MAALVTASARSAPAGVNLVPNRIGAFEAPDFRFALEVVTESLDDFRIDVLFVAAPIRFGVPEADCDRLAEVSANLALVDALSLGNLGRFR